MEHYTPFFFFSFCAEELVAQKSFKNWRSDCTAPTTKICMQTSLWRSVYLQR